MTAGGVEDYGRAAELAARPAVPQAPTDAEFSAFYREDFWRVASYVMFMGTTSSDAYDITQEAMAITYRRWREVTSPRAFVRTVARRAFAHYKHTIERPVGEIHESATLLFGAPTDSTEALAFANVNSANLADELGRLPRRQREVLALTVDGHSPAEIADILGIEANAVRVHLHHARAKVRARLKWAEVSAA